MFLGSTLRRGESLTRICPCVDDYNINNSNHDMNSSNHDTHHNVNNVDVEDVSGSYIEHVRLNVNVLVVDDSSINRKMLCRLIKDRVASVAEAVNGADALKHMQHDNNLSHIDIILMDYVMPTMDGPTATKALRAMGYDGLIIGVTGNAHTEDIETFLKAGVNKVLTKPLHTEELFRIVEGKPSLFCSYYTFTCVPVYL